MSRPSRRIVSTKRESDCITSVMANAAANGSPVNSSAITSMCGAMNAANGGWRVTHPAIVDRRHRAGPGKRASIGEWSDAMDLEENGIV